MQIDLSIWVSAGLCYLPVVIAILITIWQRRRQREHSRSPFTELQRRPAGESLRCKLEELDDKINEQITFLVLFPAMMTMAVITQHPKNWSGSLVFWAISATTTAIFSIRLSQLLRKRANYRLGFEGERLVGEELSRLQSLGFEVYHDVPFDGFNVDHVLVGARGVFIVETKTRRKPLNEAGKKEYKVQFDGNFLHWPWGPDNYGIEQAKTNAKTMAGWLGSATGEAVWVTPILTLPGWMVELKAPSDGLYVLNPKQIFNVCAAQPEKLPDTQIRRICHQMDQKCRIAVS
jgi:Nuclease-related domain